MGWVVTGATGFLGSGLLPHLLERPGPVLALGRDPGKLKERLGGVCDTALFDLTDPLAPSGITEGDTVIHLAALLGNARVDRSTFLKMNTDAALCLARAAIDAGASRFVFISTISAHGPIGSADDPLREDSPFCPVSIYGESKARAEEALARLDWGQTRPLLVRPGVIYGPGANRISSARKIFRMMAGRRYLRSGGGRSFFNVIHRENLYHAIFHLLELADYGRVWPDPAFLLHDDPCPRMAEMQDWIMAATGQRPREVNVPAWLLKALGRIGDPLRDRLGINFPLSRETVAGFCTSGFYSSIDKAKQTGWRPSISPREGIMAIARHYLHDDSGFGK